jgi:hypothetical protein
VPKPATKTLEENASRPSVANTVTESTLTSATIRPPTTKLVRDLRRIETALRHATAPNGPRPASHGVRHERVAALALPCVAPKPRRARLRRRATSAEVSSDSSRKSTGMRGTASHNAAAIARHTANHGTKCARSTAAIERTQGVNGRRSARASGCSAHTDARYEKPWPSERSRAPPRIVAK